MPDLVEARWTAGYPVELPGGQVLQPGDTAQIPAGEARQSEHWQPVRAPKTAPAVPEEGNA